MSLEEYFELFEGETMLGKKVVRTLEELIDFNIEHKDLELPPGEKTASL